MPESFTDRMFQKSATSNEEKQNITVSLLLQFVSLPLLITKREKKTQKLHALLNILKK